MILPRKGEVAPKATEGEDAATVVIAVLPLRLARARHLPLAGEDQIGLAFEALGRLFEQVL